MIRAEINNCNNILSATIQLQKNHLNIRYAMNGTGKSTIASAITLVSKQEDLSALQTFGSEIIPTCVLSEEGNKVLLFVNYLSIMGIENVKERRSDVLFSY